MQGGTGSNPILPMEKCVFSHFSPWGKMGRKVYGKKGKRLHFPLFPYAFFPIFPHGQKWGWTPPYIYLPKTKKFGCMGRGDLTFFFSKVVKY